MIENLISYFEKRVELSDEEKALFSGKVPLIKVPKGEHILNEGQISREFFFVCKGCVRMYYNANGEEKTSYFYEENSFPSSYESYVKEVPSNHYLQCIEDTTLAIIKKELANQMLQVSPKFGQLAIMIMEEELSVYQELLANFVMLSPEQRYQKLLETQPHLLLRIPQQYLATYLGVRPETLSRIRKRVTEK